MEKKKAGPRIDAVITDVQDKAKVAYAKGSKLADEAVALTKGNVEAVTASGKALGAGLKEIGGTSLEDGRQVLKTVAEDLKELSAVTSPSDVLRLQGKLAARNLDVAMLYTAKNAQILKTLAASIFAPLSERTKANLALFSKAA